MYDETVFLKWMDNLTSVMKDLYCWIDKKMYDELEEAMKRAENIISEIKNMGLDEEMLNKLQDKIIEPFERAKALLADIKERKNSHE